jgi:hypothetical protein
VPNSKYNEHIRLLLTKFTLSLGSSERKQVESLLKEVKMAAEQVDQLSEQLEHSKQEMKRHAAHIQELSKDLDVHKQAVPELRRHNAALLENNRDLLQSLRCSEQIEVELR